MDQCLCRLVNSVVDHLNIQFKELHWNESDIKVWSFWEKVADKEVGQAGFDFLNSAGFFRNLKPYDEAVRAFKEMDGLGHDVVICTSPLKSEWDRSSAEKTEWVKEYLGDEHANRIIFIADKSQVPGDVIIDDQPRLTANKHDIKFKNWLIVGHPYNEQLSDELTMLPVGRIKNDWSNWREEFAKLDLI